MARWVFEPGHSAAEFCVRHMMVTWVRGHFKNVRGTLEFDPEAPQKSSVEAFLDAPRIWTGEAQRDDHLRSPDFLDAERHPLITFKGNDVQLGGPSEFTVTGDLTIRGVTHKAPLRVTHLGQWETPYWEDGVDKGPMARAGFTAQTILNRHDFGVSWQASLVRGGFVVGNDVLVTIDVEALWKG